MTDYPNLEQRLSAAIHLERRPVAVAFRQEPPAGVSSSPGTVPRGAVSGGWPRKGDFLHSSRRPLQLPDRELHAQHRLPEERAQELTKFSP